MTLRLAMQTSSTNLTHHASSCIKLWLVSEFRIQIPPRSPDLNSIEYFFHLVQRKRKSDALGLNITKETLEEFKARIIRTIYSIPVEIISRTIA